VEEDKLKNILQEADRFSGGCVVPDASVIADFVRGRVRRRNLYLRFAASAAAVFIVCAGILNMARQGAIDGDLYVKGENIEQLQAEVARLQSEVDSMQIAVRRAIEEEKSNATLAKLEAELASISDPIEDIQRQVDRTAFIIVYQADRMYRDHNLINAAIESYKRAIEFFPANKWSEVARNRLIEIQSSKKMKRKSNTFKEMFNANYEMFSSIAASRNTHLPCPG
jgi:predicted transcriptional regulator